MILANTITISTETAWIVGTVFGFGIILNIAVGCVTIWAFTRRQPPISEEISERLERCAMHHKEDLNRLAGEIKIIQEQRRDSVEKLYNKIEALRSAIETVLRDFARDIGGLEGVQKMQQRLIAQRQAEQLDG